jgi:hypothetical protein
VAGGASARRYRDRVVVPTGPEADAGIALALCHGAREYRTSKAIRQTNLADKNRPQMIANSKVTRGRA